LFQTSSTSKPVYPRKEKKQNIDGGKASLTKCYLLNETCLQQCFVVETDSVVEEHKFKNFLFSAEQSPFETTVFYQPRQQARGSTNAEWVIRSGVGCVQGEVTGGQGEGPGDAPGG
jgi:hypothetical protein